MAVVMSAPAQVIMQPLQQYDVRALWYSILPRGWNCLAVVSPDRTPDTMRLGESLAGFGTRTRAGLVELVDATELDVARVATITHRLAPHGLTPKGERHRFVVGLDSPILNPLALGIMAACDSALLLVLRGETTIPSARRTVEFIGRERLLGAVIASNGV